MARPIGSTLVAHLRHFLDEGGEVTRHSYETRKLGLQLARVVEAATSHPGGPVAETALPCRRRPGNMTCSGRFLVQRHAQETEVHWVCPGCGDNGVITGWEGTRFDLRAVSSTSSEEQIYQVRMPEKPYQAILGDDLRQPALRRLVAGATCGDGAALLSGTADEMRLLVEHLAHGLANSPKYERRCLLRAAMDALAQLPDQARTPDRRSPVQVRVRPESLPPRLYEMLGLPPGEEPEIDQVSRLKQRIDGALPARAVTHRDLDLFMRGLQGVLDDLHRVSNQEPLIGMEVYAYFIGAMARVYHKVHDELEMNMFCTALCCEAIGLASQLDAPTQQAADLIQAMMRVYLEDELYWFVVVPSLIVALDVRVGDAGWLAEMVRSHMPAENHQHQRELEWMLARLEGA